MSININIRTIQIYQKVWLFDDLIEEIESILFELLSNISEEWADSLEGQDDDWELDQ